jgi:dolichol-phosphate mannosyltransferase
VLNLQETRSIHAPGAPGAKIECSIVVPSLNEAANLPELLRRIFAVLENRVEYEVVLVDDGSVDDTISVLRELASRDGRVRYLSLSRNFGHQAALRAGLERALGNCVVTMDADLQHPPELIPQMLDLWQEGIDIVATRRSDGLGTSWFKRTSSRWYYGLLSWLGAFPLEAGSADFRLLDRAVVNVLNEHRESALFYRSILPELGFRWTTIDYRAQERLYGTTKYSMSRMFRLALDGVLATSIRPLRLATFAAVLMALATLLYSVYALVVRFVWDTALPGWTSVIIVVSLLGAIQLLAMGIIGEYLGRTLREVRGRPLYVVRESSETPLRSGRPRRNLTGNEPHANG